MFQTKGICYHTGYKPKFHEPVEPSVKIPPMLQRVMSRHYRWVDETRDVKWPS